MRRVGEGDPPRVEGEVEAEVGRELDGRIEAAAGAGEIIGVTELEDVADHERLQGRAAGTIAVEPEARPGGGLEQRDVDRVAMELASAIEQRARVPAGAVLIAEDDAVGPEQGLECIR